MRPIVFIAFAGALALPFASMAQAPGSYAAEKARISQEQRQAEEVFKAAEKACYQKFAVTDCINEARSVRRVRLSALHRQEVAVNDEERKRKGAERLRAAEEKAAAEKEAANVAEREKHRAAQKGRVERAAQKAATAAAPAPRPGGEAARQAGLEQKAKAKASAQHARNEDAAKNLKNRQAKEAEAKERKDRLAKRLAERTKPAAKPLPVPP